MLFATNGSIVGFFSGGLIQVILKDKIRSLEDINTSKTNFLASIYIENTKTLNGDILEIGVCCIDLSIGKNIIYEIPYKKEDTNYIYDELYKFINSYNPSEIIISFKNVSEKEGKQIIDSLEINKRIIKTIDYDEKYKKMEIQENMLKEIFFKRCRFNIRSGWLGCNQKNSNHLSLRDSILEIQ